MKKTLISTAVAAAMFASTAAVASHDDIEIHNTKQVIINSDITATLTSTVKGVSVYDNVTVKNVEVSNTAVGNNLSVNVKDDVEVESVKQKSKNSDVKATLDSKVRATAKGKGDLATLKNVEVSNTAVNNNMSINAPKDEVDIEGSRSKQIVLNNSLAKANLTSVVVGKATQNFVSDPSDVTLNGVDVSNAAINNNLSVEFKEHDSDVDAFQLVKNSNAVAVATSTVIGSAYGTVGLNSINVSNAAVGNNVSVTQK